MEEPSRNPGVDTPVSAPVHSRVRMVYLLLAVFTFVALAPLCSVAWKLIDGSREELKLSTQEYQHLLASTIANGIDIHVEALCAQLDRGSRAVALAVVRSEGTTDERVHRALDALVDDRVRYVRFTDLSGKAASSPGPQACPRSIEPAFAAVFRVAAETLESRRGGDLPTATHGDPFLLPGDAPRAALLVTAPVVSGGTFLGVLSAIVDLQSVWDGIVEESPRTGNALFAVDRAGHLFASSNLPGVEFGRDMTDSALVGRSRDHSGQVSETLPFVWSPRRAAPAQRYMGSYVVSAAGWGVFVQATESQVYHAVSTMIESTVQWGLLALVCALAFAGVFARVLASPIKRLAKATRAYARKDFSARVRGGFITEAGELADRFNTMAAELEEHIQSLKRAADENKALFRGTAQALVGAIDAKDPYTRGHSKRVNKYSVILARYHGLSEDEVNDIDVSSLLHDVGKIGIDDAILKKPGQLTPEQFEVMKEHTVKGEKIMAPIRQMKRLLPGLRWHHERWKGGGYPDNLQGEAIPLMARIIAVADSFDAMTTDRPYQKAMTFDQAHARLNEMKGSAFDEHIIEAFNRAYRAGEFTPQQQPAQTKSVPEPTAA